MGEPCALKGACTGSGRGRQKRAAMHLAGGLLYSIKCADDVHHCDLFLLIHRTGKVFHKALSLLVLERIC